MKHSIIYSASLSALALVAGLTSCEFEQEDFFDQPAALRIESTNADIKAKLCAPSSQNGWLIQYFVAGTDDLSFEGFNLFGKFYESGKVTLSSDHRFLRNGNAGKYTEYDSYYEMLKEEGSVLAFNTWNDVLTVFVDPVSPSLAPNIVSDNGEGMKGDDRLVMISYSDDAMLFRGERHGALVRFSRLDCTPQEYLEKTAATRAIIASDRMTQYRITNGTETMYIKDLNKGYFQYVDRLIDPLSSEIRNCVFTPQGFSMQKPYTLGEDTYQDFVLNAECTQLTCGNVVIYPCWLESVQAMCNSSGKASITAEGASESFAALFNKLAEDVVSTFSGQTFTGITFGKSSEAGSNCRVGIVFICASSKTKYQSGFTATISVDPNTGIATITADANDPSNNFSNYSKKGIGSSFTDIVEAMNGQYNLTPNNVFNPTSVVWTKVNDSSFYFTTNF